MFNQERIHVDLRPQPGPQEIFLSTPADIAIYGGAAGGGKTWALLFEQLRHVKNPLFGSVIFRRTYPQIIAEGGMWDESSKMYVPLGAEPRKTGLYWTFPSGMRVRFAHMQYERHMYDWQGSQIPLICFDELTHFTSQMFFYMMSRNRTMSGVRPYIRGTCNPDADSFAAEMIAWWIDQETGYPIPERAGQLRYFVRINEEMHWGDSKEELKKEHGSDVRPMSFTFVPSTIFDNKALLEANPEYLASLKALPLVERERLLGGNWKIRPSSGRIFDRSWFKVIDIDQVPAGGIITRFWDLAASEKKTKGDDPDFTASVKMKMVNKAFYILDSTAFRKNAAEVDKAMLNLTRQDAHAAQQEDARYRARWEIEPGSAGLRENLRLVQMLAGIDAGGRRPQGDKITRGKGLAAQAEAGNVYVVKAPWTEAWLTHMHHQPDLAHDDTMDASTGSFNDLIHGQVTSTKSIY